MDRQDELLEREDGRYYAIDKLGTGTGSIATSEQLDAIVVGFGLPSAPALYLNAARRAYLTIKDVDPKGLSTIIPPGGGRTIKVPFSTILRRSLPTSCFR